VLAHARVWLAQEVAADANAHAPPPEAAPVSRPVRGGDDAGWRDVGAEIRCGQANDRVINARVS
jgi:hypothetical protein